MEIAAGFQVTPREGERPGAFLRFPFDRALLERFRDAFPRARWRAEEECWWVPGATAAQRLDAWIGRELSTLDRHADERGRDAHAFDPLPESPYLAVGDGFTVRTPYSRTVVQAMRKIPWARWDGDAKAWRVPFRSVEELRALWPEIEEAARRNEPAAKRARKDAPPDPKARALQAERRRRRLPVSVSDPAPLGTPVSTQAYGLVIVEGLDADPLTDEARAAAQALHGDLPPGPLAYAHWRIPTLPELFAAKPKRGLEPGGYEKAGGCRPGGRSGRGCGR
jgi:hypothetical protein